MSLEDDLLALDPGLPARFERRPDGTLAFEAVVAERKTILSREKLVYRAHVRVDDGERALRFHELLKESSRGLAGGLTLQKESVRLHGKERTGTAEERSRYLGRRYDYDLDYGTVRRAVEEAARSHGYSFELVLRERSLRS